MMYRIITICIAVCFISFNAFAQQGNNQIGVGVDVGLPMGDFGKGSNVGVGGSVKGMYGVGTDGQVELTVGYISFGIKESTSSASASTSLIPIMAGYRHHLNGFYLEPQLGVSMMKTKINIDGFGSMSGSSTGFGWAVGGGYLFDAFDLSARYQSTSKNGNSSGFIGLRIGYNFSF